MTNGLGSFDPNVLPMDAFELKGAEGDVERVISLKAPWKFEGESVSYPQSGYVSGRGWWTKFADGTLIQSNGDSITSNLGGSNLYGTTSGITYYGNKAIVWPIAFYAIPKIGKASHSNGVDTISFESLTVNGAIVYAVTGSASGRTCNFSWIAIGRWKA